MKNNRIHTSLFTVLILLPNLVNAQNIGDVAKKFSLIGHWAQNCKADAVPGNWHLEYSPSKDGKILRRMFRSKEERFSYIDKLEELDSDTILIHEVYGEGWGDFKGGEKEYQLHFTEGYSKYQSITSSVDGKNYIKDGKITTTGATSPVIEKCGN